MTGDEATAVREEWSMHIGWWFLAGWTLTLTLGVFKLHQLSLSRLNHRLPWGQAHPEVMQGTTEFHHHIADAVLPQPDAVFHDAAAPDAPVHRLDPQAAMVQGLVRELLLHRQLLATGFLRRHEDLDLGQRKRQEAQSLSQLASRGQGRGGGIGNRLLMDAAAVGVAEKEDEEQRID